MGTERGDIELEFFRRFAIAAGISSSRECGKKRNPPEPDILFLDSQGNYTAFELVELLDQEYGGRIGLLVATKTALRTYYEGMPAPSRQLFGRKFDNALLYFRFPPTMTFKRRSASFEKIFRHLLSLPNGFTGEAFEENNELEEIIDGVSISRGRFVGPIFDPEAVGWIGDPTVPTIRKKFAKIYETPHPVELLAYIEINPMFPDEVWISDLEEFLSKETPPFPFRRIWVYHVGENKIKFIHPKNDP